MKAAIVKEAKATPVFGEFDAPKPIKGFEIIEVKASALSNMSKRRSEGVHYTSQSQFPIVAGADGIGITKNGKRVYFAMPEAPYGALAEQTLVESKMMIPIPGHLDTVTTAALVNPAISGMAALTARGEFVKKQTVLINGATSTAGTLAVQIAKYLGAKKIIATARNKEKLEALKALGADATIAFNAHNFEELTYKVMPEIKDGLDIVLDYIWGNSSTPLMMAIAQVTASKRVNYVIVGEVAGEDVVLPTEALRMSAIEILGSGMRSVPMRKMLRAVKDVFKMTKKVKLSLDLVQIPLEDIESAWKLPTQPRVVITIN